MSVAEHIYGIPSEEELDMLVGAATPHFAFQIRDRIAAYADALPPDHPRQAELRRQIERLERLGYEGEPGGVSVPDLPPRRSVPALPR
jgi:hypothetical protein